MEDFLKKIKQYEGIKENYFNCKIKLYTSCFICQNMRIFEDEENSYHR